MLNPKDSFARIALLAKRILMHAYGHATKGTIPDRIIAIHDIHNAVEWLLVAIHDFYAPQITLPIGFKDLFDHANDLVKSHTGNSLPLKKDIMRLTDARNNAQHRAYPSSIEELQAHITISESFFRSALAAMNIGMSYDDLSLADLLSDDFVVTQVDHDPVYDENDNLVSVNKIENTIKVAHNFRQIESVANDLEVASHTVSSLQDLLQLVEDSVASVVAKQVSPFGMNRTRHLGGVSSVAGLLSLGDEIDKLFPLEIKLPLTREGVIRRLYVSVSIVLLRMTVGIDLSEWHKFEWLESNLKMEAHDQMPEIVFTDGKLDRETMRQMGVPPEVLERKIIHKDLSTQDIQWAISFAIDVLLRYQSFINEQRSLKRGVL
ncbi:hypothetical protein HY772_06395 [Candidatus Woesearchaeota archaeon]|nr:hypothetical protein [Candidatus Woesearchaeota archaeon]